MEIMVSKGKVDYVIIYEDDDIDAKITNFI